MKEKKKDVFGINMKQWCRQHEAAATALLREGQVTPSTLARHREKLAWLQHERLIHLIVTVLVSLAELFVVGLTLLCPQLGIWPALFMLGFAILLGFYYYHYFFLENTVQRWYRICEEMEKALEEKA